MQVEDRAWGVDRIAETWKPSRRRKPLLPSGQDIQGPRIREHKELGMELLPEIKLGVQKSADNSKAIHGTEYM